MNCTTCTIDSFVGVLAKKNKRLASSTLLVYQQALLLSDMSPQSYGLAKANFVAQCKTINSDAQEDCLGTVFEDLVRVLPEFISCLGGSGGFLACLVVLLPVAIRLVLCLISNRTVPQQLDLGSILACAVASLDFDKLIQCLLDGDDGGGNGDIPDPDYDPNTQPRC